MKILYFLSAFLLSLLSLTAFAKQNKARETCNVNNLTNKTYYTGYCSVNPQKPTNFATSLAYKF